MCKVPWLDYYSEDNGNFRHYEADLTFMLGAAQSGQSVIYIRRKFVCPTCVLGELDRHAVQGTDGAMG